MSKFNPWRMGNYSGNVCIVICSLPLTTMINNEKLLPDFLRILEQTGI